MKKENDRKEFYSKLIRLSVEDKYDPETYFNWTESINENCLWMNHDLMSFYGTKIANGLSEEQIIKLSKWELINFFSMSINGEVNIKMEMLRYLNSKYFVEDSEYFIHFLGEENSHIYFFSKFCKKFGDGIYQYKKLQLNKFDSYEIERYIVFAQTIIAEEIGDYFNVQMAKNEKLPMLIREINKRHHEDEARHIAMGRKICAGMWAEIIEGCSLSEVGNVKAYLKKYLDSFLADLYNPKIYLDSKMKDPYELREAIIKDPYRLGFHARITKNLMAFLNKNEMI